MARGIKNRLPFLAWPDDDRKLWQLAFEAGDLFDDDLPTRRLASASRIAWKNSYDYYVRFVAAHHPERLALPPAARCDRELVAEYVEFLRRTCRETTVALRLDQLYYVMRAFCPESDWSWLRGMVRRISRGAKPLAHKSVLSDRLFALGTSLMDLAASSVAADGTASERHANLYRDGLMIALLAAIPLRLRTLTALRIGKQLVRAGARWELDIPGEDTKTGQPLDYVIAGRLSAYVDEYLLRFRSAYVRTGSEAALWLVRFDRPISAVTIRARITRRTKEAFGFPVSPHRFRHAAGTFCSVHDPANVRVAKDLLGHASFSTTQRYYISAQSRIAGRALQSVLRVRRGRRPPCRGRMLAMIRQEAEIETS